MKFPFSSAVLCSSIASALALPLIIPRPFKYGSNDILTAIGASSSDQVSLHFEAPCHGCFVGTDPGLVFDVAINRALEACGEGHIRINGQAVDWSGNTAEGAGIFPTPLTSDLDNREVNATWKVSCVANEAQILSFQVQQVGQGVARHGSGFTISFRQQDQPEVLRVVGESIDISYPEDLAKQWTHPDRPRHFTLALAASNTGKSCLDDEYVELETLNAQAHDLQTLIGQKKHRINRLLRDDFRTFCSTIKKCDSLKCIFRTTMHKLPEYAHIISLHFRHHRPLPQVTVSSEKDPFVEGVRKQGDDAVLYGGAESPVHEAEFSPSPAQQDEVGSSPAGPTHTNHHEHASSSPVPSQTRHLSPTPTPHHTGNDQTSPSPSHNTTISPPHVGDGHLRHNYLFIYVIPSLLLIIILSSITFLTLLTLRHFRLLCASPRSQVSRSSSREERRTRRSYRRAELKHAWRNWWNRYRRPTCTHDYEEKRTLILEQESVLEDAMQDEIRGLRVAQEIFGEMFLAEEGRSRLDHQANMPQHQCSHHVTAEHKTTFPPPPSSPTAPVSETSLPGHRRSSCASSCSESSIPPPRYEQELEGDIDVVDGFMYSPTFGSGHTYPSDDGYGYGDDATPDSSVVDCSPRMSFDTGRTALTTKEMD